MGGCITICRRRIGSRSAHPYPFPFGRPFRLSVRSGAAFDLVDALSLTEDPDLVARSQDDGALRVQNPSPVPFDADDEASEAVAESHVSDRPVRELGFGLDCEGLESELLVVC